MALFDFQKLHVYQKAKTFAHAMHELLKNKSYDHAIADQLRRASLSIMLNIAENSSRFTPKDRRRFLVIARGSLFECVAILEWLGEAQGDDIEFDNHIASLEELSKMLYSLIRKLS